MNCFLFPGQPLQRNASLPGDDDWNALTALCRQHTCFDPDTWSWSGIEGNGDVALQIYGVATSLHGTRLLKKAGVKPRILAEHSMGIYPALACCGSLSEGEALELTCRAGLTMSMAGSGEFALGCVIGLTLEPVLAIAENNGVYLANHNTCRHFLLSGEQRAIEEAMTEATCCGAFSARVFSCDAPLHTPLLAAREDALREVFGDYHYREPSVPLMNHLDQDFLAAGDLADFMMRELLLPVHWEQTYRALRAGGATGFFEVGSGDSLKKYNRWIDSQPARK